MSNTERGFLSGNTLITTDSGDLTIEQLARDLEYGIQHRVFSYWDFYGIFSNRWIKSIKKIGKEESCRIYLSNNKFVDGTPDCKLIRADGTFVCISELEGGEFLLPFNKYMRPSISENIEVTGVAHIGRDDVCEIIVEDLPNIAIYAGIVFIT